MRARTLSIQFACPDRDEDRYIRIEVIYDAKTAENLTRRISAHDRDRIAELIEPALRTGHQESIDKAGLTCR